MFVKAVKSLGKHRLIALDLEPRGQRGLVTTYVYIREDKALIVDPGPMSSSKSLLNYLSSQGVEPEFLLVSHIHLDHAGGCGYIVKQHGGVKVFVHPRGYKHLVNPTKLWSASKNVLGDMAYLYGEPDPIPEENLIITSDGEKVRLLGIDIKFIHTPGHASHHQSIIDINNKILYPGDSLGMWIVETNSYIPSTPPPFKYDLYVESIEKMRVEKPELIHFPHTAPLYADNIYEIHEKQLESWLDLLRKELNVNREKSIENIAIELSRKDDNVYRLLEKGSEYQKMLLYSSIEGLISYINEEGRL